MVMINESNIENQMKSLDESFGVESDFSQSLEVINDTRNELAVMDNEIKSLVASVDDGTDFGTLKSDITKGIERTNRLMDIMEEQIVVGCPPAVYEAASEMIKALTGQQKELRQLIKDRAEVGIKIMNAQNAAAKNDAIQSPSTGGTVNMTPEDLMAMLDMAKGESNLNAVDAEFEIAEE
jgi:hypothetical protein